MAIRKSCGQTMRFETWHVLAMYDLQTATLGKQHRLANMGNTLASQVEVTRAWYALR